MRVFLVEPYFGGSHRAWATGWARTSDLDITIVDHPAEFWRWRMRGAAVTMAERISELVAEQGPPDCVVCSDMIDLAALRGLCAGSVPPDVPWVLYLHENQLLYPLGPGQLSDIGLSTINWVSMVAADELWWNSAFQHDSFFDVIRTFLHHQPDQRHEHLIETVRSRSVVQPVGVDVLDLIDTPRSATTHPDGPLVLWNQRWDHDKNPGAVFRALVKIADDGVPFRFALAGENQRVDPQEFAWVIEQLGDRVVHVGHLDRADYRALLVDSDIVVSAAHHEFFGIAIVEAIAGGAVPVLPDRQSYPEVVEPQWHDAVLYPDGELRRRLLLSITEPELVREQLVGLRDSMGRFDWSVVAPSYDSGVRRLAG